MMAKKESAKKAAKVLDSIKEPIKKAGKVIKETSATAVKNSAQINVKVIDHAESNAREAFAAMRAAATAGSVQNLVKIQSDFVKEQGKRSLEQAKEVGKLIARFGREAMDMVRGK